MHHHDLWCANRLRSLCSARAPPALPGLKSAHAAFVPSPPARREGRFSHTLVRLQLVLLPSSGRAAPPPEQPHPHDQDNEILMIRIMKELPPRHAGLPGCPHTCAISPNGSSLFAGTGNQIVHVPANAPEGGPSSLAAAHWAGLPLRVNRFPRSIGCNRQLSSLQRQRPSSCSPPLPHSAPSRGHNPRAYRAGLAP